MRGWPRNAMPFAFLVFQKTTESMWRLTVSTTPFLLTPPSGHKPSLHPGDFLWAFSGPREATQRPRGEGSGGRTG